MTASRHARFAAELSASEMAEQIARLLYRADCALNRKGLPEQHWNQIHSLEQTRYRSIAQQTVMSLDPMTVSRAESQTIEWVMDKLHDDIMDGARPTDELVRDACSSALSEFSTWLEKAWRMAVKP